MLLSVLILANVVCNIILPPSSNIRHPRNFSTHYVVKQMTHVTLSDYHIWIGDILTVGMHVNVAFWRVCTPRIPYNLGQI